MYGQIYKPVLKTVTTAGATATYQSGTVYNAIEDDTLNSPSLFSMNDVIIERIGGGGALDTNIEYYNKNTDTIISKAQFDAALASGLVQISRLQDATGKEYLAQYPIEVTNQAMGLAVMLQNGGMSIPANANHCDIYPILQTDALGQNLDLLIHAVGFTPDVSTTGVITGIPTQDAISITTRGEIEQIAIVAVPSVPNRAVRCVATFYYVPN